MGGSAKAAAGAAKGERRAIHATLGDPAIQHDFRRSGGWCLRCRTSQGTTQGDPSSSVVGTRPRQPDLQTNPMQPDDRALEAYSRFVARRARGDGASFADFVAAHPDISVQLQALDERYRDWQSVFERLSSESHAAATEAKAAMDSKSGRPDSLLWQLKRKLPRSDRYQLLGEIGRGGMGVVVKVWDEELQRHLAMKVVLGTEGEDKAGQGASQPDPRTLGRFLEEAQITGQLEHPCIVPVHELGLGADGQVYFTMRLVKGEDL